MTSFARNALFASLDLVNTRWLQRHSPLPFLCPYHHLVCDQPVPYIAPLYRFKTTRQFEKDLDYLLRYFKPASLPDVIHQLSSAPDAPQPARSFLLCFDDGLRLTHDIALPILLAKGIPAALFVNPCFIGNNSIFHSFKKGWLLHRLSLATPSPATIAEACRLLHDHLTPRRNQPSAPSPTADQPFPVADQPSSTTGQPLPGRPTADNLRTAISRIDYNTRCVLDPLATLLDVNWDEFTRVHQPFMTMPQLSDWIAKGMAIGAHSMDHPLYSRIPLADQLSQTIDSMDWVSDNLHVPYRAFAFPHLDTGVGSAFFQRLFEAPRPPDLVFGNSTGMQEAHPRVLHRYIGENPGRSAATMAKAVLAYSAFRKFIGSPFVHRV